MKNDNQLRTEIRRQMAAGSSSAEIRQKLLQQYPAEEIEAALKRAGPSSEPGKRSGSMSLLALIVSIYFIFSGLIKISKHTSGEMMHTWGIILLLAGVAGAVWKIADWVKR